MLEKDRQAVLLWVVEDVEQTAAGEDVLTVRNNCKLLMRLDGASYNFDIELQPKVTR